MSNLSCLPFKRIHCCGLVHLRLVTVMGMVYLAINPSPQMPQPHMSVQDCALIAKSLFACLLCCCLALPCCLSQMASTSPYFNTFPGWGLHGRHNPCWEQAQHIGDRHYHAYESDGAYGVCMWFMVPPPCFGVICVDFVSSLFFSSHHSSLVCTLFKSIISHSVTTLQHQPRVVRPLHVVQVHCHLFFFFTSYRSTWSWGWLLDICIALLLSTMLQIPSMHTFLYMDMLSHICIPFSLSLFHLLCTSPPSSQSLPPVSYIMHCMQRILCPRVFPCLVFLGLGLQTPLAIFWHWSFYFYCFTYSFMLVPNSAVLLLNLTYLPSSPLVGLQIPILRPFWSWHF